MTVYISPENSKLGKIPNISGVPIKDCTPDAPCIKRCYGMKAIRLYPAAREAWENNSKLARVDPARYFAEIYFWLRNNNPKTFRVNTAGDFINQEHLNGWKNIARLFTGTRFLAFTKRHDLNYRRTPSNLKIVFSYWPGWGDEKAAKKWGFHRAWMRDKKNMDPRIPDDAIQCSGQCTECGAKCWSLNQDVVFDLH